MTSFNFDSAILRYIIEHQVRPGDRLPTINDLSKELGISVSKVREDLEVVRALGLVQVRPRSGMQVQPFDFGPAATLSVLYALGQDRESFHDFAKIRKSIELAFWDEAVRQLTAEDIVILRECVDSAHCKLTQVPIHVPFEEHRTLHLTLFRHLTNPFVQGLLQAYWTAYQAYGLALYADISYHRDLWRYHEQIVECVASGDYEGGRTALADHMSLLRHVGDAEPSNDHEAKAVDETPIYHFFE